MWKVLCECVAGTSHAGGGTPCQDAALAASTPDGRGLVLACADGAGSASASEVGADLACRTFIDRAMALLAEPDAALVEQTGRVLAAAIHQALIACAAERKLPPRELACTFLGAVVTETAWLCIHVGDGALVLADPAAEGGYACAFWPDSGEYHNTTHFISDERYAEHLHISRGDGRVLELAMLTDGLQMLALDYANRRPHAPFFHSLFRPLRAAADSGSLRHALRRLMDSPAVNARTDDDKTLILVTQRQPEAPPAE